MTASALETSAGPEHAENVARVGGRVYTDPVTDEKYPSVTTIIDATQSKHGLISWACGMAASFAVDHFTTWQAIAGNDAAGGRAGAVDIIAKTSDRYKESRGELGSLVHSVVEALVLDAALPVVESGSQADGMLNAFIQWMIDYDVDFFMSEITVANRTHRYAGTLDGGVKCRAVNRGGGGRTYLIDVKTGTNVWPAEVLQQLVAYERAEEAWLPFGVKDTVPEVDAIAVLHLKCDDTGAWSYDFLEADEDKATRDQHWAAFTKRVAHYYAQRGIGTSKRLLRRVRRDNDPWYITDLPSLSRAVTPLAAVGITALEELTGFTDTDIKAIDGIGPKMVAAIRAAQTATKVAI